MPRLVTFATEEEKTKATDAKNFWHAVRILEGQRWSLQERYRKKSVSAGHRDQVAAATATPGDARSFATDSRLTHSTSSGRLRPRRQQWTTTRDDALL